MAQKPTEISAQAMSDKDKSQLKLEFNNQAYKIALLVAFAWALLATWADLVGHSEGFVACNLT